MGKLPVRCCIELLHIRIEGVHRIRCVQVYFQNRNLLTASLGTIATYKLKKRVEAVRGCRTVGKKDMKLNDSMPKLTVDPETYRVEADGKHCTVEAATSLPLTQSHMLF